MAHVGAGSLAGGRYTLVNPIGAGHFGEVWEAYDSHLAMPVAVKLFGPGVQLDAVLLEARLHNRLSAHPNVVTVHNVVVEPPRPFVVTSLCGAGSVGYRLEQQTVSLVDAMRWTRDMLVGLAHAHTMGVLHRDLKPSNLLLLDDGRAALTDFGVAEDVIQRVYVDPRVYARHMAPEIATGGSSSPRSDVWAASCTWYRLLTGEYPFGSLAEALSGSHVPVHHRNPQVPIAVSRAIARGLALDPEDRYADAQRMLAAVAGLRVANSWERLADPEAIEAWAATTRHGNYEVRLVDRPRVGLELTATRDLRRGGGARTVRRSRPASLARARQEMRQWLVTVVERGSLS